jgi:hypothetical protein
MTDTARALASRANGCKSRGPKTMAGKARAVRNARRHGLTVPVLKDPTLAPEVGDVARRIEISVTGGELDARGHDLACRIAEAIIDLRRVRTAKLPLATELQSDPKHAAKPLKQLARLERYERRAFARRKRAIREFLETMAAGNAAGHAVEAEQ